MVNVSRSVSLRNGVYNRTCLRGLLGRLNKILDVTLMDIVGIRHKINTRMLTRGVDFLCDSQTDRRQHHKGEFRVF